MKVEQKKWSQSKGWLESIGEELKEIAQLIFVFGGTNVLKDTALFDEIRDYYPKAHILGCSTAGEISTTEVTDDSIVLTAIYFESTSIIGGKIALCDTSGSYDAGQRLAASLPFEGLKHVFVLSDGLSVNGSELVKGLKEQLPKDVTITGGLAGDGPHFKETLVFWDSQPEKGVLAILGFYGEKIHIGYGSFGGWDSFGPERLITRSEGNVLYELDGHSVLELYKRYLGEHAIGLPATGLLFPLSLRTTSGETGVVRTILAVNEDNQSLTFAGDVPKGSYATFMKANFDKLVEGARNAASISAQALMPNKAQLAILISCVGRKLVLKQRIEEEVEIVQEVLGDSAILTGFYSYGEISPFMKDAPCELHNQTMTITTLTEE